jgi:hypothetical protein
MAQYGVLEQASKNIWGFDPTSIGGCTLWFDGADPNTMFSDTAGKTLVTNGGSVARWNDKSISANNSTQATSGNRPVYNSGGYITFTQASSHHLTIGNAALLPSGVTNGTYFVVTQRGSGATSSGSILAHGAATNSQARQIYDGDTNNNTGAFLTQGMTPAGFGPNSTSQSGIPD